MEAADSGDRIFKSGRIALDVSGGRLLVDGSHVELRPQSFDVLRKLVENAGAVVSKEELLSSVWEDRAVTEDSLTQCIIDIRRALSDSDKRIVRTIPRRGYVFEGDLLAPDDEPDDDAGHANRRATIAIAIAAAAALGALALWQFQPMPDSQVDDAREPSIAVLPFVDMTAVQDQRHLAEGIAEEVLNLLASSSSLKVIARTSAFSVARSGADIEAIGEQLGVSHVLEGSVRQGTERLRISVQLVDATTSEQTWSESYDRPAGDILEIQSDIAISVANALHTELTLAPHESTAPDPFAHSLVIQARSLNRLVGPGDGAAIAEELLREALELDPANVDALTEMARTALMLRDKEGAEARYSQWERSIAFTDRALELDPADPVANAWRGWHEISYFADYRSGARYLERAMAVDPRHSDVLSVVINACTFFGQYRLGVELGSYIVDRDPFCIQCGMRLSQNALLLGDFELAESELYRLLPLIPEEGKNDIFANLADVELWRGDPERALELLERVDELSAQKLDIAAQASFQLGRMEEFDRYRLELIEEYGEEKPETVASVEAASGNTDSAFAWLDRNLAQPTRERGLNIGIPSFKSLYDDPRWMAYLHELKMTPEQRAAVGFSPRLPFEQ